MEISGKQQKKLDYRKRRAQATGGTRLALLQYESGLNVRVSERTSREGTQLFGFQVFLPGQNIPVSWIEFDPEKAEVLCDALDAWLERVGR